MSSIETVREIWITNREAAQRARLCIDDFLRRCRRGEGPASSGKGRLRRFKSQDVDAWIERGFE